MRFPVRLKQGPEPPDAGDLYYEVAANGVFQVKETALFRAVTRVTHDIPGLQPSSEQLVMKFPRLPDSLIEEVLGFFEAVHRRWQAEAIVLLFFEPETRGYLALAPPQRISGYRDHRGRLRATLHLDYENVARPEGTLPFGSIHSHSDLAAYSSGVDCEDELESGDGLHVVYGHFGGSGRPSRCAAFVSSGRRFRVDPSHVLSDCAVPERCTRQDWMAQVDFEETREWAGTKTGPWPVEIEAGEA